MSSPSEFLSPYTTAVLYWAASTRPPDGWTFAVAADSDLIVKSETDGNWVGLRMVGIEHPKWELVRGSAPESVKFGEKWDTIGEAMNAIITGYGVDSFNETLASTLASLRSGDAIARAVSVITVNLEEPDFLATVNLYKSIFEECSAGELIAFLSSLGQVAATAMRMLSTQLSCEPADLLQGIALSAFPKDQD